MMLVIISLIVTLIINFLLFFVAFKRQSDKLTDFAYSLSFIIVTLYVLLVTSQHSLPLVIMSLMVIAWALRLGIFLVYRIRKSGKDARFDGIRSHFGQFLKFWLGQGVVAWFLLLPLLFVALNDKAAISPLFWVGCIIWLIGVSVESVADIQKYRFNQNPKNKGTWIDSGVWKYSRHPNYFGEICVWVGMYVAAFASLTVLERVIGVASPVAIAISLLFISGIPILEKSADKRWGGQKAYQAYKRRTSILIPLWRKK